MTKDVVTHPHRDLMAEAELERDVVESQEAQALQTEIFRAVRAYSTFLEEQGLVWGNEEECLRMKAQALVITFDYGNCDRFEIALRGGALDRVYGNGVNPDPDGLGPGDIPHKHRMLD